MRDARRIDRIAPMSNSTLSTISTEMADAVAAVAVSVIQVQGRRRPASGVVYADDVVLTTMRAIGREDGLRVTTGDGRSIEAELAAWDPASSQTTACARASRGRAFDPLLGESGRHVERFCRTTPRRN